LLTIEKTQQFSSIIGLAPSRHTYQQQQLDDMDVDGLRRELRASQTRVILQQRTIDTLQAKIVPAQEDIQVLHGWHRDGQKEHEALKNEYKSLGQHLAREKHEHRNHIAELEEQVHELAKNNVRLREIILSASEKQIPDADVVSKYTRLCQSIIGLVRLTWKPEIKAEFDLKKLSGHQREFFESRIPLSYNRLRSVVFQMVDVHILSPPNYFLKEPFWRLEESLRKAERHLSSDLSDGEYHTYLRPQVTFLGILANKRAEHDQRVTEWRNATMKATESLRDNGSRLSATAQDKIWDFLSPLEAKNAAAETNGRQKLKAICDNAVELSLMMRQLKDKFWVYSFQNQNRCPKSAEEADPVPIVDGQQAGTIAYVVTGALIKRAKEGPKKNLVLEKGEVAVFE
jgi:hypothetical protein